jgi:hypothetical protein
MFEAQRFLRFCAKKGACDRSARIRIVMLVEIGKPLALNPDPAMPRRLTEDIYAVLRLPWTADLLGIRDIIDLAEQSNAKLLELLPVEGWLERLPNTTQDSFPPCKPHGC